MCSSSIQTVYSDEPAFTAMTWHGVPRTVSWPVSRASVASRSFLRSFSGAYAPSSPGCLPSRGSPGVPR